MKSPLPRLRPAAALAAALTATLVVAGCATGPRPSFDADEPARGDTGDAAVDAVLDRLDAVRPEQFTARYEILTRLGGLESTATVVQADNSRRSVTINDVRFLNGSGTASTCNVTTGECEASINDARVSNVQVTHEFYGSSFAQRLRVDANRRIADTRGYEITQADRQALCVDVPVSGGTKSYCAFENGPLARYDGADLFIQAVSLDDAADETAFGTG
jgi:hypothetical protein